MRAAGLFIGVLSSAGSGGVSLPTEQEIAQELVTPTKLTHWIVAGDSRMAAKQGLMMTHLDAITWGGAHDLYLNVGNAAGAHQTSNTTGGSADAAPLSPYIDPGNPATWWPTASYETEFLGGNEPSTSDVGSRIAYTPNFLEAAFPLLWDRFQAGGDVKLRMPYYRHAGGMSGSPGVRLWWRASGNNVGDDVNNAASSFVTDVTGSGYGFVEVTLTDGYDWVNEPTVGSSFTPTAQQGASTTNTETFSYLIPWAEAETGAMVHNWSVGGASTARYISGTAIPSAIWTDWAPLLGDNRGMWIAIGTNGYGTSQAQHETDVTEMITRFRSGSPSGSIICTTEYPRGDLDTDGVEPYYVPAKRTVSAATDGFCLIDTYPNMPTFPTGQAVGFYPAARYTANGAQSSGSGTLVVNEAIDGGTAASGNLYIDDGAGGRDTVPYSSWSVSTFTLTGTLPANVPDDGLVWTGDTVHATDATGVPFWLRVQSDLVRQKAGTVTEIDQGLDGATLIDWMRARHVTSNGSRLMSLRNDGSAGAYEAASATTAPAISLSADLDTQIALTYDGSDDALIATSAASTYTPIHNGSTRVCIAIVFDPASMSGIDRIWNNNNDLTPGLSFHLNGTSVVAQMRGSAYTTASVTMATPEPALAVIDIDPLGSGDMTLNVYRAGVSALTNSATLTGLSASDPSYLPHLGNRPTATFQPFTGDIAEVVIATGATATTISNITARLRGLYGLE